MSAGIRVLVIPFFNNLLILRLDLDRLNKAIQRQLNHMCQTGDTRYLPNVQIAPKNLQTVLKMIHHCVIITSIIASQGKDPLCRDTAVLKYLENDLCQGLPSVLARNLFEA